MTGREICTRALRLVNILDPTETIDPDQLRDTFQVLQDVTEELSLNRQLVYRVLPSLLTLVSGTAAYTIGLGGNLNVPRPLWIDGVSVIPDVTASPVLERPIGPVLNTAQYQGIAVKTQTAPWPTRVYYDFQYDPTLAVGLGNLYVWPVPNTSNARLKLYLPTPIPNFTTYNTDYTFPPGYSRLIRYKTAVEACGFYGVACPPRVERTAERAETLLKRVNFRPQIARFDRALVGRRGRAYDIYGDQG